MTTFAAMASDLRTRLIANVQAAAPGGQIGFENDPSNFANVDLGYSVAVVEIDENSPAGFCTGAGVAYRRRGRLILESGVPQGQAWGALSDASDAMAATFPEGPVGCVHATSLQVAPPQLINGGQRTFAPGPYFVQRVGVEFEFYHESNSPQASPAFMADLAANLEPGWLEYSAAAGRYLTEIVAPLSAPLPTVTPPNRLLDQSPDGHVWSWQPIDGMDDRPELAIGAGPTHTEAEFTVYLAPPYGSGDGHLWEALDLIHERYAGLDLGIALFGAPVPQRVGPDGSRWAWNLSIPIRAQR